MDTSRHACLRIGGTAGTRRPSQAVGAGGRGRQSHKSNTPGTHGNTHALVCSPGARVTRPVLRLRLRR